MELKSIFDGWQHQAYGTRNDGHGNRCALGWLDFTSGYGSGDVGIHVDAVARIARYIKSHYPNVCDLVNTAELYGSASQTLAVANNALGLTPQQFRAIDYESQIAEGMAAVERLVNDVPEAVHV